LDKPIVLTMRYLDQAEDLYPNKDPDGDFSICFQGKNFIIQKYVANSSEMLKTLTKGKTSKESVPITLKWSKNELAFESVMKLLFGCKDVKIPLGLLNEVYMILLEMGINNKEKFRENVESILLQNLNPENVFEVYEMSLHFNKDNINTDCLEFIKKRNFKDLVSQNGKILVLEENTFKSIMKFHTTYKNEKN